MRINRLNIGEEVRKKVDENGLSKAKFAELLGIARQNIEKTVFQKHSLDTDLLCNISEVLNCNFFDYYRPDNSCNKKDYTEQKEIKATLSIEMGAEKKEQVLRFVFGDNNIEILNK
ncbi:helix-turn-helix domain-containing protein [uncultured Parabacteroides sp.]|jgi:transcriptional regulator with XRE-family HTH domain|uniref:helix-turn-helix domain-containing protein n=1 Tax=uncultured Parabacteroides sp. TaxID=512312 RepID=UPI0026581658|nr:helix-turn-helix transcriptional regulator [uncultured Parabacteroides sp.]